MAKIFGRLIKNSKLIPKNLASSGLLQYTANIGAASNFNFNFNFNFNSNFNFNFSTNILYTYHEKKPFDKYVSTQVSVLTYPLTDSAAPALHSFNYDGIWRVRGHSHDLVCFSDMVGSINLYNLVTNQFLQLPSWDFPINYPHRRRFYLLGVGFGYDAKSNDFKVVRVADSYRVDNGANLTSVQVYNFRKHRWREIKTPVFGRYSFDHVSDGVCYDGFYYWIVYSNLYEKYFIQSFDMSEEVFHSILMPTSSNTNYTHTIMVWNGSVVVITYPLIRVAVERRFDIWAMDKDEFGAVWWTKLLTIGPFSKTLCPLLFVNSDQLLMGGDKGEVISYDVKTRVLENLPVKAEQAVII